MEGTGLTTAEAARRLEQVGPNELIQRGRISVWSSIGLQLRDPLVAVLLAACVLTLVTGDYPDAAVIAFVVLVNTTVGVTQEVRADRAITALAQLSAPIVRVRRDGVETSLPAASLVPGDVVMLGEGDIVPADCDLLEASSVLVDESALTGESIAVGKVGPRGEGPGDALSSGTVVVKGRAVAVVARTGASSALGQIAALMDTRVQPTPLQRRLAELGRTLALVAVALCSVVLVLGLARGEPLELMLVTAISLAVAAVPESLPAVVTLSLALGARRMVARNAVVRRLPAVETLGSVTILATDKTGTLTEARMLVEELWTPEHSVGVSGQGYAPHGALVSAGAALDPSRAPDVIELLRACVLCNDAHLTPPARPGEPWSGLGDPTELALLSAAGKAGMRKNDLDRVLPRVGEVPFDSATQRMTTAHVVVRDGEQRVLVVTKGSVEALHTRHGPGREAAVWRSALVRADDLAGQGFRVLALTAGEVRMGADWENSPQRLLGLVAMNDPAKPAARATIEECRTAGIVPVLITGDHPATARAVALRVGVLDPEGADRTSSVVTGPQITAGEVADLTLPRVFARTTPEQKLDIVQAWKDRGAVVAMTGDGVNDGPALHRADIGVAMGHRGTEVARQSADLVLADDDLATVVAAVQEGRRVYANIRRFLVFGLSGGAAEILVMLVGPFVGLVVPLVAAQILWINLLTHGITGVAIGAEPVSPDAMNRPPRPSEQSVLGDGLWQRVVLISVVLSAVTLALGLWAHHDQRAWQTMIFLALTCLQLGVAIGLRPVQLTRQNPLLPLAVAGSFVLGVAGVYVPVLQDLLGTSSLPAADFAVAVATGILGWLIARATPARSVRQSAGRPGGSTS
ncbi:cation-translocating P-type ATPase [Nocardioides guangzhouensis]|uniref:cation-translocating P-type ATPase n=1 Tax=Nocardioides guangzhouensis TaxID=2497878 RepID=UPI001C377A27|nr:cation-translocating P-type ATPase [Nocardioides guangzhouensis]